MYGYNLIFIVARDIFFVTLRDGCLTVQNPKTLMGKRRSSITHKSSAPFERGMDFKAKGSKHNLLVILLS